VSALSVLNPIAIWQGHVLVKRVFWVWGVLGNIVFEVFLRHQIPSMDLAHPRLTFGLWATGFYFFTLALLYRSKNGSEIIYDTTDQQQARCIWALVMFGFMLMLVNGGVSISSLLHRAPPVNQAGSRLA
jgi:hypothetical protein